MNKIMTDFFECFAQEHIDAFLVTNDVNMTYLTGFPAAESRLLITKKGSYYITDFRYILEAKKGLKGIIVKQYTQSMDATLFELAKDLKLKTIGFDDRHLTLAEYKRLGQKRPKSVTMTVVTDLVERFRQVKTAKEMRLIRQALAIHQDALKYIKRFIKPGVSEKEVFLKLEQFVKSRDVGFSFDPIVASGSNSCYPHASVTNRIIKINEPVLVDMGIDYKGYKSDLTRMFFLGKISNILKEVNAHVKEAQLRAIAGIKPGVSAAEIDALARNYLKKQKLAKYFGHSLGHGVGLEIHENPRLSEHNPAVLKEGMVITIEPGVYIPHKFGVRLEEMVLVTGKGHKVLSDNIH